jgi:hypothetical protein
VKTMAPSDFAANVEDAVKSNVAKNRISAGVFFISSPPSLGISYSSGIDEWPVFVKSAVGA